MRSSKILILIIALFFTVASSIAQDEKSKVKIVYKTYLPAGELITVERTKNNETNANAYTFDLYITQDEEKKNLWVKNIDQYTASKDYDIQNTLKFHDVSLLENFLFIVYTFEKEIYFDTIEKKETYWDDPKSKKINSELAKTGLSSANIFQTGRQAYLFLEDSAQIREYWHATVDPPKLVWTSKNEESRSTNTYDEWLEYIKTRAAEEEKKKKNNSANSKSNNPDERTNSNENSDGGADDDESESAVNKKNGDAENTSGENSDTSATSKKNSSNKNPKNYNENGKGDSDKENSGNSNPDPANTSDGTNTIIYITTGVGLLILLTLIFLLLVRKKRV